MSKESFIVFQKITIDKCFISLVPDTRHEDKRPMLPICIRFFWTGTRKELYHRLPYKFTRTDFIKIAKATGRGRISADSVNYYSVKLQLTKEFERLIEKLRNAKLKHELTYDFVKGYLSGSSTDNFLTLWEKVANSKKTTTRNSYLTARKSFIKHIGEVSGFMINPELISKWENGMKDEGLSKTTIGIYERTLKVVWKQADKEGLMSQVEYPFGASHGGITIPTGHTRKKDYLPVNKMTELYTLFIQKEYPQTWSPTKTLAIHQSLGLFLVQYLCNGCNLADLAQLRYDDYYYQTSGKALHFIRKKTEDRSSIEVIIPIIEPLKAIFDSIASPPEKDTLLFPSIKANSKTEEDFVVRVATVNGYIRKNMKLVSEYLKWNIFPSSTWARHSFATNLSHAGVPTTYISESMGHTIATQSITQRYIDIYPLDMQFSYNEKLLGSNTKETVTITKEEYERLLLRLKEESAE